ncbi:MAG: ArsR/SmtB family transcription factor [Rhodoglobus sp.]
MADIFDVVADETRRDLLQVLLEHYLSGKPEAGDISVGDLVEHVGLSQPTVSKHLKVLRDHGLVTVREERQHRFYRLDVAPLEHLEGWLSPFLAAGSGDEVAPSTARPEAPAARAGSTMADTLGRRIAEGSHQARTVMSEASVTIHEASDAVVQYLPKAVRRRLFGDR